MATRTSIPADDSAQRKRLVAEVVKRLRTFLKVKVLPDIDATFTETLVATILSQNTNDANSSRAYYALRMTYPTWADVAAADPDELAETIRIGGLADQKSRTIIATLEAIHERYGSFEPENLEAVPSDDLLNELTKLKGVGLKTAACVLMFALGRDVCAVDTHVHRVVNRLGLVTASTPDKTFHALRPLIPKGRARQFHVDLILFGRRICKAQRPHCFECPLYDLCGWDEKEAYAKAGVPGAKPVSGDFLLHDMFPETRTSSPRPEAARPKDRPTRR